MISLIPHRYNSPKWLAKVSESQAFVFKDGTSVRSFFDLKQALMSLSEDVVVFHIDPNRHDIAAWIDHAIGDHELAAEIGKQHHRWGIIVALERGLMRTLNLPPYVASRWLAPASSPFVFQSGETASSLEELANHLKTVSDQVIDYHRKREPNDFSAWIENVIGDYDLADMLSEVTDRVHLINVLEDHLVMLKDAASATS